MSQYDFTNLISILENENQLFEELREISVDKTNVIVARKIGELEQITVRENKLTQDLLKLEEEREKEVKMISELFHVELDSSVLEKLLPLVGGDDAFKIDKCCKEMNQKIAELRRHNELNAGLLKNSLEYVDFLLNIVTNVQNSVDNNYSEGGKLASTKMKKASFDIKL